MKGFDAYYHLVYQMLTEISYTRDHQAALISACYKELIGEERYRSITFSEVMQMIDRGELPAITSIVRNDSRVQNDHPEVRGLDYEKRRKNSKNVKEALGYGEE